MFRSYTIPSSVGCAILKETTNHIGNIKCAKLLVKSLLKFTDAGRSYGYFIACGVSCHAYAAVPFSLEWSINWNSAIPLWFLVLQKRHTITTITNETVRTTANSNEFQHHQF
jgi:hypothetical protein